MIDEVLDITNKFGFLLLACRATNLAMAQECSAKALIRECLRVQ